MAQFLKQIPTNLTEYPNSFKRQGAFPLEAYSVFYTKAEADTYAASDPLAYVGQTIAVALDNAVTLYVIDQNSQLKEVGSLPVGDDQSVTVVDGKIQLADFSNAVDGTIAQIQVTTDEDGNETGRTLVWTDPTTLVNGIVGESMTAIEGRVVAVEKVINEDTTNEQGDVTQVALVKTFADADYNSTTGKLTFKDTQGNEVDSVNLNIQALVKSVEYMATATVNGQVFTNVLVLTDANNNKTVVELDDLVNIYTPEENATDVQLTITSTDGGADADTNVISAKLTDEVKEDIAKGVTVHDAITHEDSDLEFAPEGKEDWVVIKEGRITTTHLAPAITTKLGAIDSNGKIAGSNVLGPVAEATNATTANKVANALKVTVGDNEKSYDGSNAIDVAFDPVVFAGSGFNEEQVTIGLNPNTVFVLNGGNASGYTIPTDESTEV